MRNRDGTSGRQTGRGRLLRLHGRVSGHTGAVLVGGGTGVELRELVLSQMAETAELLQGEISVKSFFCLCIFGETLSTSPGGLPQW